MIDFRQWQVEYAVDLAARIWAILDRLPSSKRDMMVWRTVGGYVSSEPVRCVCGRTEDEHGFGSN